MPEEMAMEQKTSTYEQASPVIDPATYRSALGSFVTGVTIVTTRAGDTPVGTTVSAFSALSLGPPLILVSLALKSETLAHIKRAGFFSVNILSAGQHGLAARFATSGGPAKFDGVAWHPGENGAPLFDGAGATLECDLEDSIRGGDHDILVGFVRMAAIDPALSPLVYYRGGFVDLPAGVI